MAKKVTHIFALFCFCFVAGYSIIHYTTTDAYLISRDPAAIGRIYDFSKLNGEELRTAVKQRLLAGFEIEKRADEQGVSLGHFVFIDSNGDKKFACQEYNKIALIFLADGMATAGEQPTMQVEGACEFSGEVSKINPLWIPVAKILNEKPADGEIQFNQGNPITLRFNGIPSEWPKTWILKSVELKKDNSSDTMSVEGGEISKYLGHPAVLKF